MQDFNRGAIWGILPSILFFLVAFFCFKRNLPLPIVLIFSFTTWTGAAIIHQWLLKYISFTISKDTEKLSDKFLLVI